MTQGTGDPGHGRVSASAEAVENLIARLGYSELLGTVAASLGCDAEMAGDEGYPPAVAAEALAIHAALMGLAERARVYQASLDAARSARATGVTVTPRYA